MTHDEWVDKVFESLGAAPPVLTNITKKYLASTWIMRDAMPKMQVKQELNGELMDDEGIDLSEVPVCVRCGLEMANRDEHETWHHQQESRILDLMAKVDSLEQTIKNILSGVGVQTHMQTFPHPPTYISDEEIRKYSQNPGKHSARPYRLGEKWDKL